jgi:hypothetical protein
VFIVCVFLCTVFRLIVVLFCVMCVVCVLCLIVVPLPPGGNPFAVKINVLIFILIYKTLDYLLTKTSKNSFKI